MIIYEVNCIEELDYDITYHVSYGYFSTREKAEEIICCKCGAALDIE